MNRIRRYLAGAVTGAALFASAGSTQAQDAAEAETPAAGMSTTAAMQHCMPGGCAGTMPGADMPHGMMGQAAMPTMMFVMMPVMMVPGMTGQGMLPMMMPGMTGHGMMPMGHGTMPMMPGMMGDGMMGGQGMMGQGTMPMMSAAPAASLDPDQVRPHLEHHVSMMGLPNLTLGSIEEQDDDTLVADIVTRDGTLVQRLAIDRHTGAIVPLE